MYSAAKMRVAGWSRGAALKYGWGSGHRSMSVTSTNPAFEGLKSYWKKATSKSREGLKASWESTSAYYFKKEERLVYHLNKYFTLEKTPIMFCGLLIVGGYLSNKFNSSQTGRAEYLALKMKHADEDGTPQQGFDDIAGRLVSLDSKLDGLEDSMATKFEELSRGVKSRRARLDSIERVLG